MNNARPSSVQVDAPRDLRTGGAGAGNLYPVDPCAVTRLKIILAKRKRLLDEKKNPVVINKEPGDFWETKGANMKGKRETSDVVDLSVYPVEVVVAARAEAAKKDKRTRRYGDVFTPEVVAVWQAWREDGRSVGWIGKNNGLLEVPETVVHAYLFKHKKAAAALGGQAGGETAVPSVSPRVEKNVVETAVADDSEDAQQPAQAIEPFVPTRPENLPEFLDRDYRPVPRVGDTLGNLIRLLNDERVQVEGEVDLKLKIKFGGK